MNVDAIQRGIKSGLAAKLVADFDNKKNVGVEEKVDLVSIAKKLTEKKFGKKK